MLKEYMYTLFYLNEFCFIFFYQKKNHNKVLSFKYFIKTYHIAQIQNEAMIPSSFFRCKATDGHYAVIQ